MGVVAVGAQEVAFGAVPIAHAAPVDTLPPIAKNGAVALATQAIGLVKPNQSPVGEPQAIAVVGIVAVKTPPVRGAVIEMDVLVKILELPPSGVDLHIPVALGTGVDPLLGERWRRHPVITSRLVGTRRLHLRWKGEIEIDLGEIRRAIGSTPPGIVTNLADAAADDREKSQQRDGNEDDEQDRERGRTGKELLVRRLRGRRAIRFVRGRCFRRELVIRDRSNPGRRPLRHRESTSEQAQYRFPSHDRP